MPSSSRTTTKKTTAMTGFLVRFIGVGRARLDWEERIPRPVDELSIVRAVKRKKALLSRDITAPYVDDYGGRIYAGIREVGRYVIVSLAHDDEVSTVAARSST